LSVTANDNQVPHLAVANPMRGAIFDVANVLYDTTSQRRLLWRLVHHLGLQVGDADFYCPWERNYLADVHCGRREFAEARHAFLLAWGLSWAQIDELEAAVHGGCDDSGPELRSLPGAAKTLRALAQMKLELVAWQDAACGSAELAARLEMLGLRQCFHAVLSSLDVEAVQPSPACYQACLTSLKLPAAEVIYVGHDPDHLAGAKAAGLVTVTFNDRAPAEADLHLTRLEDLLPWIHARAIAGGGERCDPRGDGQSGL
jgi:FMN phosphatase YigB (HAD superfamily)